MATAPQVDAGEVYELRFVCTHGQQVALNIKHFFVAAIAPNSTQLEFAQALSATFGPLYVNLLNQNAKFRGVGVRKVFPAQDYEILSADADTAGAIESDPLPKQICGLIAFRATGITNRRIGRLYVPFPAEASNDPTEGRPNAAYRTSLEALGLPFTENYVWMSAEGENTGFFIIPANDNFATITQIYQRTARLQWATQRRRGDYGATNIGPF